MWWKNRSRLHFCVLILLLTSCTEVWSRQKCSQNSDCDYVGCGYSGRGGNCKLDWGGYCDGECVPGTVCVDWEMIDSSTGYGWCGPRTCPAGTGRTCECLVLPLIHRAPNVHPALLVHYSYFSGCVCLCVPAYWASRVCGANCKIWSMGAWRVAAEGSW